MRRLRFLAIVPSSGSSRPASRLSNVDLPTPLGPTSPIRSCSSIWKLTPAKTRSAPKDFPACMTLTMGMHLSYICEVFLVYHTTLSLCQPVNVITQWRQNSTIVTIQVPCLCRLRRQARNKRRKRGHLALWQGDCVPLHPLLKRYHNSMM